ncbi:hypothetical protein CSUB01_04372 [Colletotrichum sublineola]|uniref:Uncharacterized protein n=1 Tax=Colletotrichum sublineola TaxID=1173701 RepID=A0A066XT36_COLSU|nr:hypothetical protein CSUB01_04372 [Colletotrichum sublineola]
MVVVMMTDHPGVYVISISINGRDGKFLNFFELNVTATFIEEYIEASELFSRCGKAKFTAAEKEKMAQSTRVDTAYGVLLVKSKTRFIDSASSVDELREIANGLHRRMITPSLGQNRAHEYQIQSPQYIGCSTRLSRRLKDYDVATGLKSVNKPLAFLLHVLEALGHRPPAERLFIALARSYLWQDGLNVTDGGGKPGIKSSRLSDAKDSVWAQTDVLRTNLDLSMTDVDLRKECIKNVAEIDKLRVDSESLAREIHCMNARIDEEVETSKDHGFTSSYASSLSKHS